MAPAGDVLERHPAARARRSASSNRAAASKSVRARQQLAALRRRARTRRAPPRRGAATARRPSASRARPRASSSRSAVIAGGHGSPARPARSAVSASTQRLDHRVEVAVEHLVEVVRLEADPVVGDAVLREVVGADPLGAVDGADLAAPRGRRLAVGLLLRRRRAAGRAGSASPAPCSAAGSSRSGRRRRCRSAGA